MQYDDDDDVINYGAQFGNQLAPPDQQHIIMEGMLKKKSPKGFLKAWQDRWSRLTNQGFYYFQNKDSMEEKGLVPIYAIASINCDTATFKKKGFRFDILLSEKYGGRVFSFIAKTEAECVDWVDKLRKVHTEYHDQVGHFNASEPLDATGGKIWKNKKTGTDIVPRQPMEEMSRLIAPYRLFNPAVRASVFDTPATVCQSLFGDFRVESEEASNEFGTTYIIGDTHYPMNHRSYLLHSIEHASPRRDMVAAAMDQLATYDHPAFPRHLHKGITSDTVYSISHPPLRPNVDSAFAWLELYQRFPEPVVRAMGVQLVSALDYVHARGHLFVSLSPETIFFDRHGSLRVSDILLPIAAAQIPIFLPEYTPPEVVQHGRAKCSPQGDYWRLGIFLYEVVTGFPPFRPTAPGDEPDGTHSYDDEIMAQIKAFNASQLQFPPGVSQPLMDLIRQLLSVAPASRPTSESIKQHSFFADVASWDAHDILALPKPDWVLENIVDKLDASDSTPINLTLQPEPTVVQRVGVSVLKLRGLSTDPSQRLYCGVMVEGDLRKTKVLAGDQTEWNEAFVFDLLSGAGLPEYSDLVIEVYSKKREAEGRHSRVGLVTYPLHEIRHLGQVETSMTVLSFEDGMPLGELDVKLGWVEDAVELGPSILQPLSDMSRSFADTFGKPMAPPPAKLWSLIMDPAFTTQPGIVEITEHQHQQQQLSQSASFSQAPGTPANAPQSPKMIAAPISSSASNTIRRATNTSGSAGSGSGSAGSGQGDSPLGGFQPSSLRLPAAGVPLASGHARHGSVSSPLAAASPSGFSTSSANALGVSPPQGGYPPSPLHGASATPMMSPARQPPPLQARPSFTPSVHSSGIVPPAVPLRSPSISQPQSTPILSPAPSSTNSTGSASGMVSPTARMHRPSSTLPPVPGSPRTLPPSARPLPGMAPATPTANDNAFSSTAPTFDADSVRGRKGREAEIERERELVRQQEQARESRLTQQLQQKKTGASPSPASGAPAADPNEVAANWRTAVEAGTGDTYYYNKVTKLTTWDPPECVLALQRQQS